MREARQNRQAEATILLSVCVHVNANCCDCYTSSPQFTTTSKTYDTTLLETSQNNVRDTSYDSRNGHQKTRQTLLLIEENQRDVTNHHQVLQLNNQAL